MLSTLHRDIADAAARWTLHGNIDEDGFFTGADIDPFFLCLATGGCRLTVVLYPPSAIDHGVPRIDVAGAPWTAGRLADWQIE